MAEFFQQLGFWGTFILALIPMVVISIVAGFSIIMYGFKNPMNGNVVLEGIKQRQDRKAEAAASAPPADTKTIVADDYSAYVIVEGEKVGFKVPETYVRIYGQKWNRNHVELYRNLENKWKACKVIDLTECNITSSLISLLEDKATELLELKIYARSDQQVLLNYLKQYGNIQIETR